jgi:hypothetical protein
MIGDDNWMLKYADIDKNTIVSGLPFGLFASSGGNVADGDLKYGASMELLQGYGVYSRHQTIIYSLYMIMQIFTYFNLRQQPQQTQQSE